MSLPAGPTSPAFVQSLQWVFRPFEFMSACKEKYGDCFTVRLSSAYPPIVFVSDPQAVQTLLTGDGKEFCAPGDLNAIFEPFLGKQSVIGLSGEPHRRMRQLMMPSFHGERMRSYGNIIDEITDDVVQQWQINKPFSVRNFMQSISLKVILSAVFGVTEGERYQELEKLLARMLDDMSAPVSVAHLYFEQLQIDLGEFSPWGRFLRQREQIDRLIYAEIQERRDRPDPSRIDILNLLMSAQDEAGEFLSDVELRDELMTLLTAGHETTANALTWALYWIHKLPDVRDRLLAELQSLTDPSDASAIFRLPYLTAVCSEALRIYPVALLTFPRLTQVPVKLMGYDLEPNTVVLGCIYLSHRHENVFPEPEKFKPERFLEHQFSPYEYLPFGGGSRRCIGMAFALFEMKLVLARILSQVELVLPAQQDAYPIRRGLVSAPSKVKLAVKQRYTQQPTPQPMEATAI